MTKAQYYGKLIFSLGLGRHSKFDLSGGFGYLQDRFYPTKILTIRQFLRMRRIISWDN